MLVWCALYVPGGAVRWVMAVASFAAFGALATALWRAKPLFHTPLGTGANPHPL